MRFPVHACVMTDPSPLTSRKRAGTPFRSARPRCRAQRTASRRALEPSLLRRDRHAHRRRRDVALHGNADQPARPREAVLDGSAQGSRALRARHARRARRDRGRGCALPRRRDGCGGRRRRAARSPFAPMWTISSRSGRSIPLRFEQDAKGGVKPYVRVRGELWARVTRSLALDLIALGEEGEIDGAATFGVRARRRILSHRSRRPIWAPLDAPCSTRRAGFPDAGG